MCSELIHVNLGGSRTRRKNSINLGTGIGWHILSEVVEVVIEENYVYEVDQNVEK